MAVLFAAMAVAGAGQGLAFMGGIRRVNEIAPRAPAGWHRGHVLRGDLRRQRAVTAAVGLLATRLGLTRSVQVSAAVLAAGCLLTLVTGGRAGRMR